MLSISAGQFDMYSLSLKVPAKTFLSSDNLFLKDNDFRCPKRNEAVKINKMPIVLKKTHIINP